ncbi:hypothetical protein OOT00_14315 [Desulfobotulus sp. H1]|uniref:Uncharacterized protein n=1 Tax=Desulfobotulus pelophilus TaxID=2823377 RepID=A0ABT3NCG9_9BACT|nr:hypothetical protein [Desulfobotulus pelophilus]MCW7755159.1 hypothetical protein [Desulfobotulus pelophilus]
MEERCAKTYHGRKEDFSGMAGLFSGAEIKSFFQKYLFVVILVEVGIFVACWMYQLGLVGEGRFGHLTRPFPWKIYFLTAFLAPVTMTFLLGLVVGAFNLFLYGESRESYSIKERRGPQWLRSLLQIPFLLMLLLLVVAAGLIYRMGDFLYFLDHAGSAVVDVFRVVVVAVALCGTLAGVFWMILGYQLKKKALEYHYKAEVLRCLPLAEARKGIPPALLSQIFSDPSIVAPPATERKRKESP